MTEKFKKVKALLQRPAPPKKFGTDPWEPWSATNQVSENSIKGQRAGTLARYLKSRGINPTFVSKDQRIAHTKSDTYKKWMRDHMFESIDVPEQPETADKNASDAQMSYAKKNKKKLHISKNIETPPGSMVRKTMESVELDEVLTKSTTAGETIDDFVHSKNKMFAGDSKAQRIKRALGAYKQKAQAQTKELKKHTKGEYGGIAQRMLDRRNKGLQMVSKREHKIETSSDVTEGAPIIVMPSHKRLEKKHKPSLSRGMDPAKAQGEQDARDGKPYNNPYPFKKELGAPGNWGHNSYKASYDSVKKGVAEGTISDLLNKDPTSPKFNDHSAPRKTKHSGSTPTPYEQGRLDAHRKKSYNNIHNSEQDAEDYKTGYRHVKSRQGVAEEKKDSRSASEKMSDYAVKRHKVYQGIADKQKEHIKKWNDDHKDEPHLQIPVKEDIYQDGQSATQTVFDMGNNTDDTSQRFNRVKNAMKKKHVKEDTYDWEKADKSVATPGKKPKMDKSNEKTGEATTKPKAAAVLSGGTTMTGEPRDMIEIDPSMQGRPGQDGGLPSAKTKR